MCILCFICLISVSESTMPSSSLSIKDVNGMASDNFIKIFGNIVEHYPAAAIGILKNRPFGGTEDIAHAVDVFLDTLNLNEKEKILQLHPDLAGKLADLGKLTKESTLEQKAAGLHKLSSEEKLELSDLNEKYKAKFGFSFVICARENKAVTILAALKARLGNDKNQELEAGINEVKKIIWALNIVKRARLFLANHP